MPEAPTFAVPGAPIFAVQRTIPKHNKVPHGWNSLSEAGTVVGDSKFIPIKCPLSPGKFRYPNNFCLMEFVKHHQQQGRKIGLIIDITNTDRYYDRSDVPFAVAHKKIFVVGHEKAPGNECKQFNDIVEKFKETNPDEYIVVHCTHGLNRTGFMIINYLIEHEEQTVDDAFNAFNTSRSPHGMYNPLFIDELYEKHNQTNSILYRNMTYPEVPGYAMAKIKKLVYKNKLLSKREDSEKYSELVERYKV
ncbi:RNA/RNP complex-1-interacting phosphatase [Acrasis kona]|uniref:RNA/RNP complex-1-interacting phosphatase n=1 Tax=Acrasis kona TaxID=1008807 RepID=A0AAW2ZQ18_9EUKA